MSAKKADCLVARSKRKTIRVAIIDDHPILREGLTIFLSHFQPEFKVVGSEESAERAVDLVQKVKPDAIFLDVSLKGRNGIDSIKEIKAVAPNLAILVLSMHDETIYAARALKAGALGYVMKHESPDTLLIALRKIVHGEIHVSAAVNKQMLDIFANQRRPGTTRPMELLTNREFEIFDLIGRGFATPRIAKQLDISIKTIESHRLRLRQKLHIKNNLQLVHYAINWVDSRDVSGFGNQSTVN